MNKDTTCAYIYTVDKEKREQEETSVNVLYVIIYSVASEKFMVNRMSKSNDRTCFKIESVGNVFSK